MALETEFKTFYQSLFKSLDEKEVPQLDPVMVQSMSEKDSSDGFDLSYFRIMISSWIEFLNQLFSEGATDLLLTNLNNNLNFIKRIDGNSRDLHVRNIRNISEKLFDFILREKLLFTTSFEIEEEYKDYELDALLHDRTLNLEHLVLYILNHDFKEINETTLKHARGILNGLQQRDESKIRQNLNELKAIQETVLTILQMDRDDQQNAMVRKLRKEFDLINVFYFIIRKITENNSYKIKDRDAFEFKTSYDYPFLDALKTLSKYYQTRKKKYLQNAQQIISFIQTKKPFRVEDIEFLGRLNDIMDITNELSMAADEDEFKIFDEDDKSQISAKAQVCFEFFINLFVDPGMTLLYKRKLFTYIVVIVRAWFKSNFIPRERARSIMLDFIQLDRHLKRQSLKKMGNFREISFQLTPKMLLGEFEKGLATHLLYALEDFSEWTEGKEIYEKLKVSRKRQDPRFLTIENLYKISHEIADYTAEENEGVSTASATIKKEMIKKYFSDILEEHFFLLPQLFQVLYSPLIIHTCNLVYDFGKITEEDRQEILSDLIKLRDSRYKDIRFALLDYPHSQIFSENYEKEFASIVTLLHLYIPLTHL
ncbi:MAG: hypothetical protein JXL67_12585 [Calditrichaeota bacterium]|nr:hypothetical protein [Calditrichota bacterium]